MTDIANGALVAQAGEKLKHLWLDGLQVESIS